MILPNRTSELANAWHLGKERTIRSSVKFGRGAL